MPLQTIWVVLKSECVPYEWSDTSVFGAYVDESTANRVRDQLRAHENENERRLFDVYFEYEVCKTQLEGDA